MLSQSQSSNVELMTYIVNVQNVLRVIREAQSGEFEIG